MILKLKFVRNRVTLEITNNTPETVIFDLREMISILDLRSLGYDKIKQGVLQQNVSKYYHFESADIICNFYNKFVNALKKEKKETKENYLWLNKENERKIHDRQRNIGEVHILRYVMLDNTPKRKR